MQDKPLNPDEDAEDESDEIVAQFETEIGSYGPIGVTVYRTPEYFWASESIVHRYGVGDSVEQALDDLRAAFVGYHQGLREERENLGWKLAEDLELLDRLEHSTRPARTTTR